MRMARLVSLGFLGLAACYTVDVPQNVENMPPPVEEGKTPQVMRFEALQAEVLGGATVELQYEVKDAVSVKIQMGSVTLLPASIEQTGRVFTPQLWANETITLSAVNKDKTATQSLTITVTDAAPPLHARIDFFAPDPVNIDEGQTVNLSWTTVNASEGKILANNELLLTIAQSDLAQGTFTVTPAETIIYTMSVKGTDEQTVELTRLVSVAPLGTANLTARELFDRTVMPVLTQYCKDCHEGDGLLEGMGLDGPNFMGPAATAAYGAITADARMLAAPENSLLLLKGLHSGPALTPAQQTKVSGWLLKEVEERAIINQPPPNPNQPRSLQEGLTRFNACMTREVWEQTIGANDDTQYAEQNSAEGRCYACHDVGAGGFIAKSAQAQLYDAMKGPAGGPAPTAYLLKLVTGTIDPVSGAFTGLQESYRFRDKGGDDGHPNYQPSQQRLQALTDFTTLVMARYNDLNDACAPTP